MSSRPARLPRLAAWLADRRAALWAVVLAACALSGVGLTQFQLRQDVTQLLSGLDVPGQAEALDALTRFGAFDVLLVDVSRPSGEDPSEAARALAARLEASRDFERVLFEIDEAGMRATYEALFARRFWLLAPPENLPLAVQAAARDLMSPLSMMVEGAVAKDPLDHRGALLSKLEALAPSLTLDTSGGRLMSEDGRHALLVLEPKARALDVTRAEAVLASIRAAAPEGARLQIFGPHVFATSAAAAIRRDVHVTVAGSLLGVGLLFLLAFGRVRYVLGTSLPVLVGGLLSLGLIGAMTDGLHGITLGFGAVMLGVGIDYGVHLLVHFRARRAEGPALPFDDVMQATLREVGPSLTMGAATTLAAFVVLLVSGTRALTDMVLFCGLGLAFAFGFSVVVLPQLPALFGGAVRGRDRPSARARPGPGRATALLLCVVVAAGALGALRVRFDGDIRNLDYQPPEVRAVEAEIFARYQPPVHPTLVVVRGRDEQAALRRAERAVALLDAAVARGQVAGVSTVTRLLPSTRTQAKNLARHDLRLEEEVSAAARQAGLRPEFFGPFSSDLAAARSGVPGPIVPEDLADTPLAPLVRRGLRVGPEGAAVSIVAHTGRGGAAHAPTRLPAALADGLRALGATVVSGAELAAGAVTRVKDAVGALAGLSLLVVGWLLLAYYRRPLRALLALAPAGLGLLVAAGAMGWAEVPFNIVSVGAFALVSGVGVDYGIFVTDALTSPDEAAWAATARSVRLAAGTTLLGFGALLLAHNPVMWSLGFAVSVGVLASFVIAHFVVPALYGLGLGRAEPALDGVSLLGVGLLVGLAATLGLSWLSGARTTNGAQVLVTLALDALALAYLVRRGRRVEGARDG